jgi:hypothetical protein
MADIFAKIQELVLWALAYPVLWISIAWGIVGLIGLFGLVGISIGFRLKWEARKNAKRP